MLHREFLSYNIPIAHSHISKFNSDKIKVLGVAAEEPTKFRRPASCKLHMPLATASGIVILSKTVWSEDDAKYDEAVANWRIGILFIIATFTVLSYTSEFDVSHRGRQYSTYRLIIFDKQPCMQAPH